MVGIEAVYSNNTQLTWRVLFPALLTVEATRQAYTLTKRCADSLVWDEYIYIFIQHDCYIIHIEGNKDSKGGRLCHRGGSRPRHGLVQEYVANA